MKQSETIKSPKILKCYFCEVCDYNTNNKKDYDKHLATVKHQTGSFETKTKPKIPKNPQQYICFCGDIFNSKTTLWRHKKKCETISKNFIDNKTNELFIKLINQNNDLQQMLIEQNNKILELTKEVVTSKIL
jgi:hypothetical protein